MVERTTKLGTLAVEMETHILYALANKFNKALSICAVAEKDEIYYEDTDIGTINKKNKDMTAKKRRSFNKMIESIFNSLLC